MRLKRGSYEPERTRRAGVVTLMRGYRGASASGAATTQPCPTFHCLRSCRSSTWENGSAGPLRNPTRVVFVITPEGGENRALHLRNRAHA